MRSVGAPLGSPCLSREPMAPAPVAPERQRAPRATGTLTALALIAALGVVFGSPGCLNPRPEEDPSRTGGGVNEAAPSRAETCEDNPLLAGCSAAPAAPAGGFDDADEESTAPPSAETPSPDAPDRDAGAANDAGADAGSFAGVAP